MRVLPPQPRSDRPALPPPEADTDSEPSEIYAAFRQVSVGSSGLLVRDTTKGVEMSGGADVRWDELKPVLRLINDRLDHMERFL